LVTNWLNFARKRKEKKRKLAKTRPKKKGGIIDQHLQLQPWDYSGLFFFAFGKKKTKKTTQVGTIRTAMNIYLLIFLNYLVFNMK
jgi:hypothetical protein